eukprot:13930814-Alexandrium_andersonii.AAC.1
MASSVVGAQVGSNRGANQYTVIVTVARVCTQELWGTKMVSENFMRQDRRRCSANGSRTPRTDLLEPIHPQRL